MTKVKFNKKDHTYTIEDKTLTSVTTFLGQFFEPFDAKAIAKKLALINKFRGIKGKGVRYYLKTWKKTATEGSRIHKEIEDFIVNRKDTTDPKVISAIKYLEDKSIGTDVSTQFIFKLNLQPEVVVYNEELGLAGTVDLIDMNQEAIIDWKTNEKISKTGYKGKKCKEPISHLDDCSFTRYCLQLNLYKYLIKKMYDKDMKRMFIVHLKDDGYTVIKVPDMIKDIERLIK